MGEEVGKKCWRAYDARPVLTRVIQDGVHPSLHINYKNFDLKQNFKEGRGCRTEGTFRNPNDFGVNKGLSNLPYLQRLAVKSTGACWKSNASATTAP